MVKKFNIIYRTAFRHSVMIHDKLILPVQLKYPPKILRFMLKLNFKKLDVERVFKTFRAVMYSEKRICHFKLWILKTQNHHQCPYNWHICAIMNVKFKDMNLLLWTMGHLKEDISRIIWFFFGSFEGEKWSDHENNEHWNVETWDCDLSIWNKSD